MTTWTTESKLLLCSAQNLLRLYQIELTWDIGTQGITAFITQNKQTGKWDKWDVVPSTFSSRSGEQVLAVIVWRVMSGF